MTDNIEQFKVLEYALEDLNCGLVSRRGDIAQLKNKDTGLYHYLVEYKQGWNILPIDSISGEFFTHEEN